MKPTTTFHATRYVSSLAFVGTALVLAHAGCGSSGDGGGFLLAPSGSNSKDAGAARADGSGGGGGGVTTGGGGGGGTLATGGGGDSAASTAPMPVCPAGVMCDVACTAGATTSVSGVVYDPAGKNPLYNVTVYVPSVPLQPLPKGVPTGADACSCNALYKSGAVVSTTTAVDGSFKLTNVPVGASVPLVVQVGKWRRLFNVPVTACQDNPQPGTSLSLPSSVPAGDTNDNIPDIAVSTGAADTLECLMKRIGLPESEYVAGAAGTGHIHVFSGGLTQGNMEYGVAESPAMPGAPASRKSLWDSQADLMPYDILLLSCEGGETYDANPPALEAYLNAGGRAFASHYHYAWFAGALQTGQSYSAPSDWGSALASWQGGSNTMATQANGTIVQTLNGSGAAFPKGVALAQWLSENGALGALGAPAMELPMRPPKLNAIVGPANTASQAWVQDDKTPNTMYFSFDTPVGQPAAADGGAPAYCGRAVFSDLHASGETSPADTTPPPGGCVDADLSPQEKALEFMLFDLSSCVVPDTVMPTSDGGVPSAPQ